MSEESSGGPSGADDVLAYPIGGLIGGHYEVGRMLMGGMGVVYLCIDNRDGTRVALKTFKHRTGNHHFLTHKTRMRFIQECANWIGLGLHPHIVEAYRVERIQDWHGIYLVLEWVGSDDENYTPDVRTRLVQEQVFQPKHALTVALHVARGMEYATRVSPNLVHGDLKPSNLLIDVKGQVKVADFGLSSVWNGRDKPSFDGTDHEEKKEAVVPVHRAGTAPYSAPEIWKKGAMVDCRADIYALGCIVFELLTGRRVVSGGDAKELGMAHLKGDLREFPNDLPFAITSFLRHCLALNPDQRFRDWHVVTEEIVSLFGSEFGVTPSDCPNFSSDSRDKRAVAAWSQHAIGSAAAELGHHYEARDAFRKALDLAESENMSNLRLANLEGLGISQAELGSVDEGINTLMLAREVAESIGSISEKDRVTALLGGLYVAKGEMTRAINLLEALATKLEADNHNSNSFLALGNLANAYAGKGDNESAVESFRKLVDRATAVGDRYLLGQALGGLGAALLDAGRVEDALETLGKSLSISWETGDEANVGWAFANGAAAHYSLARYDIAMTAYREAWRSGALLGDPRLEATARAGVGACQINIGELSNAIINLEDALTSFQAINDHGGIARTAQLLGNTLIDRDIDPEKGRHILEQASSNNELQ